MTAPRVRTSLERTASSFTADQLAERQAEFERELWLRHRAFVVRMNDRTIPRLITMAVEAIAMVRFGKSRAA